MPPHLRHTTHIRETYGTIDVIMTYIKNAFSREKAFFICVFQNKVVILQRLFGGRDFCIEKEAFAYS